MPVAPWQETALRVVVEFKKSGRNASRQIVLTHTPEVLPPQLQGRVHPEAWRAFMTEVHALAKRHPYTARPSVGQCCWNIQGLCCFVCVGFGIFEPDGGSHTQWQGEAQSVLARFQPTFAQGGCRLSLQEVHGSYFIQVDIDPGVAVGVAVASPPPTGGPYDAYKPPAGVSSAAAPPPGGYYQQPPAGAPPPGAYGAASPPAGSYPAAAAQYPPMQ